jgi:hypothetical protein
MSRPMRLVTVLLMLFLFAGCSSDDGEPAGSDGDPSTAEQLYGTWHGGHVL